MLTRKELLVPEKFLLRMLGLPQDLTKKKNLTSLLGTLDYKVPFVVKYIYTYHFKSHQHVNLFL